MDICRRQFGAYVLGAMAGKAWAAPSRPKLTVVIVAEELRPDALESAWPQFGTGGFRRLAEKGAWFPNCRHLSSTFTSCGLANLATGAWPAQHGMVADRWYDRVVGKAVSAWDEPLLATTLASQAAGDADVRVSAVGMTQGHVSVFAGTPAARLYFFDNRCEFTSAGGAPDWLQEQNASKGPETVRDANWMAVNATAEAPPLRTLHWNANDPKDFRALYKASPFSQAAVFDLAAELVTRDRMGQGSSSDLLCILDESASLLGYENGARSALMKQMVLQLDRRIETLFGQLTRAVGENGFTLAVCAAHGAPPEPLAFDRARKSVSGDNIATAVQNALRTSGRKVEKYIYPFLYLDRGGGSNNAEVIRVAAQAAMAQPAVAGYYTVAGDCSLTNEWRQRYQNSFHARRSGDLMLSYRAEFVEDFGIGRGVSYGSLYNYDAQVPLFFYGPQFRAGVFETQVDAVDVAPTMARAMGIAQPSSAVGRVLSEALLP